MPIPFFKHEYTLVVDSCLGLLKLFDIMISMKNQLSVLLIALYLVYFLMRNGHWQLHC